MQRKVSTKKITQDLNTDIIDKKHILVIKASDFDAIVKIFSKIFQLLKPNELITVKKDMAYIYKEKAVIKVPLGDYMTIDESITLTFDRKQISFLKKIKNKGVNKVEILVGVDDIYFKYYVGDFLQRELTLDRIKKEHKEIAIAVPEDAKEKSQQCLSINYAESKDSIENIMMLISFKKNNKASGYNIYIDKNTFEIMAIGTNNSSDSMIFNTDIVNENVNRDIVVLEVIDLFPVKMCDRFIIKIYEKNSLFYVKTESKLPMLTIDFVTVAEKKEYFSKLEKVTNAKKIWEATTDLNKFKFTVHSKEKSFLDEFLALIDKLNVFKQAHDTKIKSYSFALKETDEIQNLQMYQEIPVRVNNEDTFSETAQKYKQEKYNKKIFDLQKNTPFFTLKVTNGFDYTFSFEGLANFIEYELFSMDPTIYTNMMDDLNTHLQHEKIKVLKIILKLIKNRNLYKDTKIKSIGFATTFKNDEKFNKVKLMKFNTGAKHDLYNCFDFVKAKDVYTTNTYYKAYIKTPEELINKFKRANKDDPLSFKELETLNDDEKRTILKSEINKKFKDLISFEIGKEHPNRYYVKTLNTEEMTLTKPLILSQNNTLEFRLYIDNKANYFKISHTNRDRIYKGIKKVTGEKRLRIKEQLKYSYEVQRWDTKDKKILQKHNTDRYYFTLNDDIDDIVKNITTFTSRYKLMAIDYEELLNKVTDSEEGHFKTKKKFEDAVDAYRNIPDFIKIDTLKLKDNLAFILE